MPNRLNRLCGNARCPNLALPDKPYCAACLPEYSRLRNREDYLWRGARNKKTYNRHHEAWRLRVLHRDPICRHCKSALSTEADHIIPIGRGGSQFALSNSQGLCASCHSKKTRSEDRK